MAVFRADEKKHGIPDDSGARKKIRDGLSGPEKIEFDEIVDKIDKGKKRTGISEK